MKAYTTEEISDKVFDGSTGEWASIIPSVPEYTMTELIEKMGHKFKIKE